MLNKRLVTSLSNNYVPSIPCYANIIFNRETFNVMFTYKFSALRSILGTIISDFTSRLWGIITVFYFPFSQINITSVFFKSEIDNASVRQS
jgi:hypothetical protein